MTLQPLLVNRSYHAGYPYIAETAPYCPVSHPPTEEILYMPSARVHSSHELALQAFTITKIDNIQGC